MKMTMDQDVIMSRPKQQAMQKLVAQDDVTMLNKFPMKRTTNENKVQGLVIIQKQISNMLKGQQLKTIKTSISIIQDSIRYFPYHFVKHYHTLFTQNTILTESEIKFLQHS